MPYYRKDNKKDNRKAPAKSCYQIITLGREHLEQIMELQSLALGQLRNKEWCVYLSTDEYIDLLGEKGLVLGAVDAGELIAIYSALFPGKHHPENLGQDLNLPADELERVCHLEIAFVHPDYRGQGLYYLLGERIISTVEAGSSVRHLCGTIEPGNIPTLNNALLLGMQIVKMQNMYGGLRRFIIYRDLFQADDRNDKNTVPKTVTVDCNDLARQQELLQSGWRGVRVIQKPEATFIVYSGFNTQGG